jgi:hypothetical protein
MNVSRKLVTSLLLLALLFAEACTRKLPALPPKDLAPTIAETLPEEIPETTELPTTEPPLPPKEIPASNKGKQKKPPKVTPKKTNPPANTTVAATPAPASPPAQTPPPQNTQAVASLHPHGNTETAPEMTVAAAISSDQANKQRESTARMIDSAESALKGLTRQLNDEEKGMRTQIETFLQQSRKATTDGDYERAYKLAEKAQVLAAALTKQ